MLLTHKKAYFTLVGTYLLATPLTAHTSVNQPNKLNDYPAKAGRFLLRLKVAGAGKAC